MPFIDDPWADGAYPFLRRMGYDRLALIGQQIQRSTNFGAQVHYRALERAQREMLDENERAGEVRGPRNEDRLGEPNG